MKSGKISVTQEGVGEEASEWRACVTDRNGKSVAMFGNQGDDACASCEEVRRLWHARETQRWEQ